MTSQATIDAYNRDGFVIVPDVLGKAELAELRAVIAEIVAGAASIETHNDVYDLEPGHTRAEPKVRRIKTPHKVHPLFDRLVRSEKVVGICKALVGRDVRLHGSKLNMKSAKYGSPVEWHQDWAFYPHTNDDILAIGVLLDDTSLENGPLLCTPGTHKGPVWSHHDDEGFFCGSIDPKEIMAEIKAALPCVGPAGAMSFHHVRTLHGSAQNVSDRPRNLLLYEVAAADAWPLAGVKDFPEFESRRLSGAGPTIVPRLSPVPVRMPLPPPKRQGSIYETQLGAPERAYFGRAAE
ncbi:MAG: phytanoyl-CoA dioxygenase family protein [Acetobacteraceae bacterium]|nr:phytanoyl-CoA dioxygenase family protein [Acetobacteraceae bacterium]